MRGEGAFTSSLGLRDKRPARDGLLAARFETNLRRERQMEGIAAAKERGVYKGRKPQIDANEVRWLAAEEKLSPSAISKRLGIARSPVYRFLHPADLAVDTEALTGNQGNRPMLDA